MRCLAVLAALLVISTVPPASAVPACDVSGTWSDDFGTLYLRASAGGSVSGNYTWQNGTLSGIMDGVWLNGTWSEEPTFAGPRDAGRFSWQFGEDCTLFTGTYSYAEDPEGVAGSWTGTRTSAAEPLEPVPEPPACDPTGMWTSTHGDLNLFKTGAWEDLEANWHQTSPRGEQWVTMTGAMAGERYQGTWQTREDPTPRHFVMRFDADCGGFRGDWTGLDENGRAVIYNDWLGHRTELAPVPDKTPPDPNACDPRGKWIGTHGSIDIDRDRPFEDLRADWLNGAEWRTMKGTLDGLTYEGTWWTEADPTPRPFVMVFAADCGSFDGQWSDATQTHQWIGYRSTETTTPSPPEESTATTPATPTEHIPGVGVDEDDPLGIPSPAAALAVLGALAAAFMLRSRRGRR